MFVFRAAVQHPRHRSDPRVKKPGASSEVMMMGSHLLPTAQNWPPRLRDDGPERGELFEDHDARRDGERSLALDAAAGRATR